MKMKPETEATHPLFTIRLEVSPIQSALANESLTYQLFGA